MPQTFRIDELPDNLSLMCPTSILIAIEEIDLETWSGELADTVLVATVRGEDVPDGEVTVRFSGDLSTPDILWDIANRLEGPPAPR